MDWGTIATIIVAIVAVYGAVVSTYNFLIYRRSTEVSLKVKLSYGACDYPYAVLTMPHYSNSTPHLVLDVANNGTRPVTIRVPFFKLPNNRQLIIRNPYSAVNLPHELLEGRDCVMWTEVRTIANALKDEGFSGIFKLVGSVHDAVGNTYKSKPLEFDIDKCLES